MPSGASRLIAVAFFGVAWSTALTSISLATLQDPDHIISQRGKRFGPGDVSLHLGDHVTIVNDDADVVHHAFIDTEGFNFDSGDIEPGAKAVISFPKDGDFVVLCGIHPRMRLAVHVR